jgi:uncharacterized protein YunC (DUF1805 family)
MLMSSVQETAVQQQALPRSVSRTIETPEGSAIGLSNRWQGGQYCALLTQRGIVGCGIYSIEVADEFRFAFALAKGTPEKPLVEPEDLFPAKIVKVSHAARELGIREGMTGREALRCMLAACE